MYRYLLVVALAVPAVASAADISLSGSVSVRDRNKSVDVVFTSGDRATIQKYYQVRESDHRHKGKHGKKTPPGLAKKGGLPPGLAKRQRLPDHVEYEMLPRDLEARLPPLPSNYVRVRVGDDFAILDRKSRVVFDVAVGLTL
ncbi:hypothetical protein SVA_0922 [Sulfurifustis variabilis]|uniref:Uncharacterized protein n=1 Tax=Sulfurifustis variabilis TaxID=1675686 RepID=A0A1B4VB32_9GAMM|nr:hypothetical protein [Sulfurifustis variabilis]BAU47501.1 hypothetical protein SVA_0922 [Sulfurifustis variabilis]